MQTSHEAAAVGGGSACMFKTSTGVLPCALMSSHCFRASDRGTDFRSERRSAGMSWEICGRQTSMNIPCMQLEHTPYSKQKRQTWCIVSRASLISTRIFCSDVATSTSAEATGRHAASTNPARPASAAPSHSRSWASDGGRARDFVRSGSCSAHGQIKDGMSS